MKTIPVCLIVAGVLLPAVALAEPPHGGGEPKGPPMAGEHRRMPQRPFAETWKAADKDRNGTLSREEFQAMPRVQNLPVEKRESLFQRLDKSGDGQLSREELGRLGKPPDGQRPPMQRLWELDVDKSGGVSFTEFQAGQVFRKLPLEKQEHLFRRLDTDRDGVISPKDRPTPPGRPDGAGKPRPHRRQQAEPSPDGGPPRPQPRQPGAEPLPPPPSDPI